MGTFNATCCVSSLPILEGEPAVEILLLPGRTHPHKEACFPTLGSYSGSSHGPGSFYRPFLWPIHGIYGSAGSLFAEYEDDPQPTVAVPELFERLLFQSLRHTAEMIPEGDSPEYVQCEPMSLNELLKRRAYFHHPVKIDTSFGWMPLYSTLVRKDIWDALQGLAFEEIHEGAEEYLRDMKKPAGLAEALSRTASLEGWDNMFCHVLYPYGIVGIDRHLLEVPLQDAQKVVAALVELLHVDAHMDLLRKHWGPMTGAGSQDDEFDAHVRFADIVRKIAVTKRDELSERY